MKVLVPVLFLLFCGLLWEAKRATERDNARWHASEERERWLERQRRGFDEDGIVLIEWILAIALILMPVVGIASAAINWPGRLNAANAAAYEAARTVVESPTADTGAGEARAQEVWANHGYDGEISVSFSGDPLTRGGAFTATVTVPLPALKLPGVGNVTGGDVSRSNTQRVPDYGSAA